MTVQTACENVVLNSCVEGRPAHAFLLKLNRHIARLPAPQDCIDRLIERVHAVVPLRTRTVELVERAVASRNKAVCTHGDGDDDFSLVDHSAAATQPASGTP